MPKILEDCVKKVEKQKGVDNAWAVCTQSLQDAGKLPKKKDKKSDNYHHEPAMREPGYWEENPSNLPFPDNCPTCGIAIDWHYNDEGIWIPCAVLTGDVAHGQYDINSSLKQSTLGKPSLNEMLERQKYYEERYAELDSQMDALFQNNASEEEIDKLQRRINRLESLMENLEVSIGNIDTPFRRINPTMESPLFAKTASVLTPELIKRIQRFVSHQISLGEHSEYDVRDESNLPSPTKISEAVAAEFNIYEDEIDYTIPEEVFELVGELVNDEVATHDDTIRDTLRPRFSKNRVAMDSGLQMYLTTILWAETDGEKPLDSLYNISDFSQQALEQATRELNSFIEKARAVIPEGAKIPGARGSDSDLAYDFWLTRNGHGSGFWDGDWGDYGEDLTKLAKSFGHVDAYVGDDGRIYFSGGNKVSKKASVDVISKEEANTKFPLFMRELAALSREQFPHELSNKFKKLRDSYASYLPIWRDSVSNRHKGLMLCIEDLDSWGSGHDLMPYFNRMMSLYGGTVQEAINNGSLDRVSKKYLFSKVN
jgi:hypothetical protein